MLRRANTIWYIPGNGKHTSEVLFWISFQDVKPDLRGICQKAQVLLHQIQAMSYSLEKRERDRESERRRETIKA
jgi:hypothetical protein